MIIGNHATLEGGGTYGGILTNSLLIGNSADEYGGGAAGATLINCTVVGNSAALTGGGSREGRLENCIVWYNAATNGENNIDNQLGFGTAIACASPDLVHGEDGNITNRPDFLGMARGDYHLRPTSPCLDRGANADWMLAGTDMDGRARIFGSVVDMGAYEAAVFGQVKALLGGPHSVSNHLMRTSLADANGVPTNSIYIGGRRPRASLPSNITDWALIELISTNGRASVVARSIFLRSDGQAVNDDGSMDIPLAYLPDRYYLAVKHRNHLAAMSAQPLAYTNELITYDFTTNWTQYRGGTNACVELEPGVWGMIAGDADGDGKITHVDRKICEEQQGQTGYKAGDFNLDGVVDGND